MSIEFTKMHGAGNDFVVIDARRQRVRLDAHTVAHIADRHLGVGCDQILLLEDAPDDSVDFAYRIFNAAGTEVQQCGNGARALARFGLPQGREGDSLRMQSPAGIVTARFAAGGNISVDMGRPDFDPAALPLRREGRRSRYRIALADGDVECGALSMGNPHAVIEVANVDTAPVERVGPALERHSDFPQGVNVGFVQIVARDRVRLRVWERGVGETLACGTGACAAVAAARDWNRVDCGVKVSLPGGDLMVDFAQLGDPIWLTGPAHRSFEGKIDV